MDIKVHARLEAHHGRTALGKKPQVRMLVRVPGLVLAKDSKQGLYREFIHRL